MDLETGDSAPSERRSPITTPEARKDLMINLAYEQAELQLRNGTAPAPIVSYFLNEDSVKKKLEIERLEKENQVLSQKIDAYEAMEDQREITKRAYEAFTTYAGGSEITDEMIL